MTQLIGIDWGTSSFRAYLMSGDGTVRDTIATGDGILSVPDGDFAGTLQRHIAPWRAANPDTAIILSGMIGSRNGWVEAPYLPLPAGSGELAGALTAIAIQGSRPAHLVPGLNINTPDRNPDVMRGEETQIVGAAAATRPEATVVLPGTHTKWVRTEHGRITDFTTYMTGEVFAALIEHTILGALSKPSTANRDAAFDKGVARFAEQGSNASLLSEIFSARALPLNGRLATEDVRDYLSGLVIGAEIAHATRGLTDNEVVLIGRDDLCGRYQRAIRAFGHDCEIEPDGAAPRGQFAIATAAGLI